MILEKPKCPDCGGLAIGTVDKVVARFDEPEEETEGTEEIEFEFCGDTDLDTQASIENEQGETLVTCSCGTEWFTKITGM